MSHQLCIMYSVTPPSLLLLKEPLLLLQNDDLTFYSVRFITDLVILARNHGLKGLFHSGPFVGFWSSKIARRERKGVTSCSSSKLAPHTIRVRHRRVSRVLSAASKTSCLHYYNWPVFHWGQCIDSCLILLKLYTSWIKPCGWMREWMNDYFLDKPQTSPFSCC